MSCTCRTALSTLSRRSLTPSAFSTSLRNFSSSSSHFAPPSPTTPPAASETCVYTFDYFLLSPLADFSLFSPTAASPSSSPPSLSSCPEGTVLKGLNYLKDESPILSKPDSDYPSWLWTLATTSGGSEVVVKKNGKGKGKVVQESEQLRERKKELKKEGRRGIKAANALKG